MPSSGWAAWRAASPSPRTSLAATGVGLAPRGGVRRGRRRLPAPVLRGHLAHARARVRPARGFHVGALREGSGSIAVGSSRTRTYGRSGVCGCTSFTWGDGLDRSPQVTTCPVELVGLLQVHPEIGRRTEIPAQTQRRVGREVTLASDDLADPIGRYVDRARKLGRAEPELFELIGKDLARMYRRACHLSTR